MGMSLATVTERTERRTEARPSPGPSAPRLSRAFIARHAVLTFYVLTFAISWGGVLLVVGGPAGIPGTPEQFARLLPLAVAALLLGPPVAGLLLTGLVDGRAGYRELLARSLRWRVGARWYAVALLTAPLVFAVVPLALSPISPVFLPGVLTTSDRASLLLTGLAVGLLGGFVEELGWTGFAIPRLRRRHGVLATGLLVGVPWGAWHLLTNVFWASGAQSGTVPLALFVTLRGVDLLVGGLLAYRVLMVWVYDRTGSLPVAVLMHASLIFCNIFVLAPVATSGAALVTWLLVSSAALWVVVAAVAGAGRATARKALLGCGVLSSVLYVAADAYAWSRYPGYSPVSQAFSELLAEGAPTRAFMVALLGAPYNLLVAALGVGVWASPGRKRMVRLTGALLGLYALFSFLGGTVFQMDVRGTEGTARGALHPLATAVMVLCMLLSVGVGASLHGRRFRSYSLGTLLAVTLFAGLTFRYAPQIAANEPTPGLGLVERVSIYAWMLWVAVLALSLWPVRHNRGSRPSPSYGLPAEVRKMPKP
jgi:membrane protease YdiL (CAAX protease family)